MSIARRQVLGWSAVGLGAFALDGCGNGLPWGKEPTTSPADVDHILRELDQVVLGLDSLEPDMRKFGIKRSGVDVAQGRSLCIRLLTTMCFMGTYRDVPESMWTDPRVEARLAKVLPQIAVMLRTSRDQLAHLDDEEAARIDERLRIDPDLTMRIMERVDEYARQVHVPLEQRTYLRTSTAQLAGRYRYEGTKAVTSKLASQYTRVLAQRTAALGMQGDPIDGSGGGDQNPPEPLPLRVHFVTHASQRDIHTATCAMDPKVTLDGAQRRIVLDFEEFRCPAHPLSSATTVETPIRGGVHAELDASGDNSVTVTLYPPAGTTNTDSLATAATSIAEDLRRALNATVLTWSKPAHAEQRLGTEGESCRANTDCGEPLTCERSVCRAEGQAHSAQLLATTGKVAKWGAILLIPPICAIGFLVLLNCLFMVIVAGCMYAGGD